MKNKREAKRKKYLIKRETKENGKKGEMDSKKRDKTGKSR